jgi:hypothetical protein
MRHTLASGLVAAVLLFAGPGVAADAPRYVSPSGAFSISLADSAGRSFHPGAETNNADMAIVDFPFTNSMGLELTWRRSVEWLKLDKPVDPAQYDQQATDAVAGYLEARFDGKLVVADRGKFRDPDGRLVYAFAAKGEFNHLSAQWQGAVLFFPGGVALVSEVAALPPDGHFEAKNGVVSPPLIDWAETLRPGP